VKGSNDARAPGPHQRSGGRRLRALQPAGGGRGGPRTGTAASVLSKQVPAGRRSDARHEGPMRAALDASSQISRHCSLQGLLVTRPRVAQARRGTPASGLPVGFAVRSTRPGGLRRSGMRLPGSRAPRHRVSARQGPASLTPRGPRPRWPNSGRDQTFFGGNRAFPTLSFRSLVTSSLPRLLLLGRSRAAVP